MIPAPPSCDEVQRSEALREYAILDTPPEQPLDDLTALAAHICGTPIASISLIDGRRQWFKAKIGLDLTETPLDISFSAHALDEPDLFIVPDAAQDERFADNPLVTGKPGIRFYAGAPLVTPGGAVIGVFCVIDRVPRTLTQAQQQALRVLSGQVMTQLELRRQGRGLKASEAKLRAIFEAEPECVKLLGLDSTLFEMNAAGLRLIEADSLDSVFGQRLLPLVAEEDRDAVLAMLEAVARGERRAVQFQIIGLKGTPRWIEMSGAPFYDETSGQNLVLGISHDITARKLADEKIQRLNRLYAVSSSINEAIVRIHDTLELYEHACRIAVERGGLVMAWVGLVEPDGCALRPVARWGRDEGYLDSIKVTTTTDEREGLGPAGQAFRTGAPACCNDIEADTGSFASRVQALQRGYRSCAAFPLKLAGRPVGVLLVYGGQSAYFDREELHVLNALAENISFAIESHQRDHQRLQAEEARRVSEQRYRTLFEYAPDGIVIADAQSYYIDANASICQMLGYTRDELIGLHASDIVAPAELGHIGPALNVIKSKSGYHREWQFRRKDGSLFEAEVIATVMPDGHLMGMIRDITERKRTEARFRRLVDSNAQGVMFCGTKGKITGANDAFLRIIDYTREEMEAGRINWMALTPPEYDDLDRHAMEELAARGICAPYEKQYIRKDGSRAPVLLGAAAFEDNPDESVCFVLDLTERKKLEQQFLRAQRMESIGTLAGGIAHDLNNVLGPIIMSLDLLKMTFTDAPSQELLTIISSSAQRGADMVRQVLSFARGVEGRRMEVQVRHIVQDIERIANDTFLKHIHIRTIIPLDLWTVLGDPTQLHQVFLNLCVNARDAMPDGGSLTISADNTQLDSHYAGLNPDARAGPYVVLHIEDNGSGIPPEVIDKIFDPFFTTKEVGKGTGLGLSTTLAIIKSHGGFIRVYSESGKGATFKIYLPAQTEPFAGTTADTPAEMPRGNGELILVVDDETSVRQITQQTLEAFGYRVTLAADGAEAVAIYAVRASEIAVVLTDMMMPVMDGASTIRVLRKINPAVRVIGASGLAANSQLTQTASLGVKHFLPKPYTAETLLKTLKQILAEK
jgi:PAS domain S-box-containing protein